MDIEQRFNQYVQKIRESDKIAIYTGPDVDGISSAAITSEAIKRIRGKPIDLFIYEESNFEVERGRLLEDGDTNKVVLGYNFYTDKVGLDKAIKIGDNVLVQDEKFEVVGVAKKQGSFINDNIVLMNEKPLEDLMGYGDDVDIITVQVKDKDEIDAKILKKWTTTKQRL